MSGPVGKAQRRVDGRAKVTGSAPYAGEFAAEGLAHGAVLGSAVTRGRIRSINESAARAVPGVVEVFTHANLPAGIASGAGSHQDEIAPPGEPLRPLHDAEIRFGGQPVALVVAETPEIARYAASLLRVDYAAEAHNTDLSRVEAEAFDPAKRHDADGPPAPRGDADAAYAQAAVALDRRYRIAIEHQNPLELHATTAVPGVDGGLTVYEKTQGVLNSQGYVSGVFGLEKEKVRVISPFVGGAFGSGLRPHYQLFFAVMAALALRRPVRVVLTRAQMFSIGHRPETLQRIALGADQQGRLQSLVHAALGSTSRYEDYQETTVDWSSLLYRAPNRRLGYRLAPLDIPTPANMRGPGGVTGVFAIETAMDELAWALGIDPIELRLRNATEHDPNEEKPFSSKRQEACFRQGAERFGWSRRVPAVGAMREGRELIGWGVASGVWEAMMFPTRARARLDRDGRLEVASATADIGTGTYTLMTQIAAQTLGLPMEAVTARLGDSTLPQAYVEGGSATAASVGSAVQAACRALAERLLRMARARAASPLVNLEIDHVTFEDGRIAARGDPERSLSIAEVMRAAGVGSLEADGEVGSGFGGRDEEEKPSNYTHSAVFAEVRVDETLGSVRVSRLLDAVAAGRIVNPAAARSQVLGGMVFGLGQALMEETLVDHRLGRFMNRNLAEYHLPTNADVEEMEVLFVEEEDEMNPLGIKGLGEIGVVGTAAAIGNAIYHATGRRLRGLPITLDKLLTPQE